MTKLGHMLTASALALISISASGQDQAVTPTAFNVTTEIARTCRFTTLPTDVAFGDYSATAGRTASGAAVVQCNDGGTPLTVWISTASGARTMIGGGPASGSLNYELYLDSGLSQFFPNAAPSTPNFTSGSGIGLSLTISYFGNLPAGQFAPPGSYSQTAVFNVSF